MIFYFFFFNDTATTEIYTLSLHDALPISGRGARGAPARRAARAARAGPAAPATGARAGLQSVATARPATDRKSTRLNSSHANISYAVFCLKKKKTHTIT